MSDSGQPLAISRRGMLRWGVGAAAATSLSGLASSAKASPIKIGFAIETFQVPRWKYLDLPSFQKVVEGAGMEFMSVQADFSAERQLSQVEQLITSGCKVIAICPVVGKAGVSMVRACKKAGVSVVAYNNMIPSPDVAAFVSRDNFYIGKMAVDAATAAGALKGNWIIVSGEAGNSVAEEQTAAYLTGLKPLVDQGTVKIVSQQYHAGWSADGARDQVENALTANGNNIQGIFCNNDQMAIGCISALEKAGVAGKVFINGLDATTEGCRAIVQRRMALSAFTPCDEMGRTAAELCVKLAKGESLGLQTTYNAGDQTKQLWSPISSMNITTENMVDYLKKYSPYYVDAKAVFKGVPEAQWPSGAAELMK